MATSNLSDIWRNNQAAKHMTQKKMLEAHEQFTQLLSEKPFHPLFQSNMAASFIGVEEFQKAIQMYNEVLKLNNAAKDVIQPVILKHLLEGLAEKLIKK